jgi:Cu2+-exporting ATPase
MVSPDRETAAVVAALARRDAKAASAPPLRRDEPTVTIAHQLPGRLRLRLDPMSAPLAPRLAAYLRGQAGVLQSAADVDSGAILVRFDTGATTAEALVDLARASGPDSWPEVRAERRPEGSWKLFIANTAVLAASIVESLDPPLLTAAVAATAIPSAKRAVAGLAERRLTVDVLDLAAVAASLATGQFGTASFMTWLLGVGDMVLGRTADRARAAIGSLMRLEVASAWRLEAERPLRVPAHKLAVGDRIVVYPGERVAADGIVLEGEAVVDEKALTGESLPRARRPGDRVLAATVVVDGQIVVAIDRLGTDTAAARIVSILQGAASKPMTLQHNVEVVADRLVAPTIALAVAAATLTGQVERMTSVLITDFGTGIRIAVPTAALSAMTLAAREGVLVKGGQYLERLSRADTVVFDKTGTLTRGEPEVLDLSPLGAMPPGEALGLAAAAEAHQRHPIAVAIRRHAERVGAARANAVVEDERYAIGTGLTAVVDGRTVVVGRRQLLRGHGIDVSHADEARARHRLLGASSLFIAVDGELQAALGYADKPRAESVEVIKKLRAGRRREVLLMSGDMKRTAEAIGARLGVDRVLSELLPEDKAEHVQALQRGGRVVAMVGDGINDAPALALADVGISLRGGTEVALETADVVLLEGGLRYLPRAFAIADDAMRNVRHGLLTVLAPNAVAIVLGALGLMPPALAALVNNGSTIVGAMIGVAPLLVASRRAG